MVYNAPDNGREKGARKGLIFPWEFYPSKSIYLFYKQKQATEKYPELVVFLA